MFDITHFTLRDMTECGAVLRNFGSGARSMEETANRIVRYLYEQLFEAHTNQRCCALVRFYKTHPFGDLDAEQKAFARALLGEHAGSPDLTCLTLLASAGDKPEWNSRTTSRGHKAIPLPSEQVVTQFPMISQLVHQLGLEASALLKPNPGLLVDREQRTYNVFYVPQAAGSPHIPAQADFVQPMGIQSVLGFGGLLPTGNLFAVILFAKSFIPRETAEVFRVLALSVKLAVLPFEGGVVFAAPAERV
jgi:hypothetical protein